MSEPGTPSPSLRLDSTDPPSEKPPSETPPSETPPSASSIDFAQLAWSEPTVHPVGRSAEPQAEQRQTETSVANVELMLGGQSYQAQMKRIDRRINDILQQSEVQIALQQNGRDSLSGTAAVLFARARRSSSQSSTIEVYLRRPDGKPIDVQPAMDIDNTVATELYALLLESLPYQLQRTSDIENVRHIVKLDGKNGIPDDQLGNLLADKTYHKQEKHGITSYTADSKIIQAI